MTTKLGCFERCMFGKEGIEMIESFHGDMPHYLNRAVAGENRHKLKIDKEWAQFIYESTKMSWVKLLVLLIGIAPSFTKFPSYITQKLLIDGCSLIQSSSVPLTLGECIRYNGNSHYIERKFFSSSPEEILSASLLIFLLAVPQWVFAIIIWARFKNFKYTVWMSAAKIHLRTKDKRLFACNYYLMCIMLMLFSLNISSFLSRLNEDFFRQDYYVPQNKSSILVFTFEKSPGESIWNILSTALIYSCLITVLFNHTREPMSFFTGFRNYLKKASYVSYNTATVEYRIERNGTYWKYIKMYYEQCERYAPHIVLSAMIAHFKDLDIFEANELDDSSVHNKA